MYSLRICLNTLQKTGIHWLLATCLLFLMLSACGGGDGTSSKPQEQAPPDLLLSHATMTNYSFGLHAKGKHSTFLEERASPLGVNVEVTNRDIPMSEDVPVEVSFTLDCGKDIHLLQVGKLDPNGSGRLVGYSDTAKLESLDDERNNVKGLTAYLFLPLSVYEELALEEEKTCEVRLQLDPHNLYGEADEGNNSIELLVRYLPKPVTPPIKSARFATASNDTWVEIYNLSSLVTPYGTGTWGKTNGGINVTYSILPNYLKYKTHQEDNLTLPWGVDFESEANFKLNIDILDQDATFTIFDWNGITLVDADAIIGNIPCSDSDQVNFSLVIWDVDVFSPIQFSTCTLSYSKSYTQSKSTKKKLGQKTIDAGYATIILEVYATGSVGIAGSYSIKGSAEQISLTTSLGPTASLA